MSNTELKVGNIKIKILMILMILVVIMMTIFHESLYVRIMSLGDTYSYAATPEESVLGYIAKERERLGEDYYPLYENEVVHSVEITPDKQFLFYIGYEKSSISGLAVCARKDILGLWFVSDSMRNGTFSTWRGATCRTTSAGEEPCVENPYTQPEIDEYINEQMAKVSQTMMENRCHFKNYEHDPEYQEFMNSKRK